MPQLLPSESEAKPPESYLYGYQTTISGALTPLYALDGWLCFSGRAPLNNYVGSQTTKIKYVYALHCGTVQ